MKWPLFAVCWPALQLGLWNGADAATDGLEAARQQASGSPYAASGVNPSEVPRVPNVPPTRLQWEPIIGEPYLVASGPLSQPTGAQPAGMQEITVHVPAHALLRVVADNASSPPPQFLLSTGNGLAIAVRALPAEDGRNWLVKSPLPYPAVIHVRTRPAQSGWRIYLGRISPPPQSALYLSDTNLPGQTAKVRRADETTAQAYTRISPETHMAIPVSGPLRLAFDYQLSAPTSAGGARTVISLTLADKEEQLVEQLTGSDDTAPVNIDGTWYPGVRRERAFIDVPEGEHMLRLRSSHAILAKATAVAEPSFLLPKLNFPEGWKNLAPDHELTALEQAAISAASSNQWRDSGLLAAERLDAAARVRPEVPALRTAADELTAQFSHYRDAQLVSLSAGGRIHSYSYVFRTAQAPDDAVRHEIISETQPDALLPSATFYVINNGDAQFSLTAGAHQRRMRLLMGAPIPGNVHLEVRYDNGEVEELFTDARPLAPERLRPIGSAVNASLSQAAMQAIGPLVQQVGVVEWELPRGVKTVSVRVRDKASGRDGDPPLLLAVQELRSVDYTLDDQFLAQLAAGTPLAEPGQQLVRDALRPLRRRLDDAKKQLVANVHPIDREREALPVSKVQRLVAEARAAKDPLQALELWSRLKTATIDPALRVEALQGQVRSLLANGERYTAERLLRAHWIGNDPAVAKAAGDELEALYMRANDTAMQALFAAARAAIDPAGYAQLAEALAADGNDDLALLAGLLAPERRLPLLLQSALRSRRWQTFDALRKSVTHPQEQAFWTMQYLLATGRTEDAQRTAEAGQVGEWAHAIQQWKDLGPRLMDTQSPDVRAAAVANWLAWVRAHPGPRVWSDMPDLVTRHAGGVSLRSLALNQTSTWWRAHAGQPLSARVVGPAKIRLEARPLHEKGEGIVSGWLQVRAKDQLWVQPFHQNQVSPGLALDAQSGFPGMTVVREINLPHGIHEIEMDAGDVPVIARLQVEHPALPVTPSAMATFNYFEDHEHVTMRVTTAPACGYSKSCQIVTGERLWAQQTTLERKYWKALPVPPMDKDETASRLAAGDVTGAVASSTSPAEQMALLLWQSQRRPAERSHALARGAAIAKQYPTADVLALWQQIDAQSAWTLLPIADRSAGLRSIDVVPGTPESPAARMRAALLGPLRSGEIRLGSDSRAGLWLNQATTTSVALEITAEDLPGMPPLPLTAVVERNGKPFRRVNLSESHRARRVTLQLPPGEQQLAVHLEGNFVNQFARVRFSGLDQPLPLVSRDWHIATPTQPVQATIAGPVWLRIDQHTASGVQSEERLLPDSTSKLTLPAKPGERESLYRIFARRIEPVAAEPKLPRPNTYRPQPVPQAPEEWEAFPATPANSVRFVDPYPLEQQSNITTSTRLGVFRRQDAETTGEETERQAERFAEAGVSWRHGSADQQQYRVADLFVRRHWSGSPALGFRLGVQRSVLWTPALPHPFDISASLGGIAQDTPDGFGASVSARLAVSQERRMLATLSHRPTIEFTLRGTNLDEVSNPSQVDNEIFTQYRKDHPWSVSISDTLSWRPWRDSHGSLRMSAVSNPNLNVFKPDNIQLDLQWRQLAGRLMLETGARVIRFLDDSDRADAVTRHDLRFGVGWERWLQDGTRLQIQGEIRRNLATGVNWGGVQVQWHFGGRGYRDFSPNEIDFRSLRSWHMPPADTMRVEE